MKQTLLALLFVSMVVLATVDFASSVPLHSQVLQQGSPTNERESPQLQGARGPANPHLYTPKRVRRQGSPSNGTGRKSSQLQGAQERVRRQGSPSNGTGRESPQLQGAQERVRRQGSPSNGTGRESPQLQGAREPANPHLYAPEEGEANPRLQGD